MAATKLQPKDDQATKESTAPIAFTIIDPAGTLAPVNAEVSKRSSKVASQNADAETLSRSLGRPRSAKQLVAEKGKSSLPRSIATALGTTEQVSRDPLRSKLAIFLDALGSSANAAAFLGVARSQPGKWLSGQERPNPRARRQIQDFEYVWDRLTDERTPEAAHIWLNSANSFLNGSTPLIWLKTRGAGDVIVAIDAEESGSYA